MIAIPDIQSGTFRRAIRARRQPGALCAGARRLEGRGGASGPAEQIRLRRCDDLFRPRPRRCAHAVIPPPRRRTSPNWPNCAKSCARPRMPIGPSRSTSSGRSRRAWVLYAEGKYDEALKAMSAAADAEDKTEKHPVTPGSPTPGARALWAKCCSSAAWRSEALAAFEATLKKEPNRFNAIVGAAKAAQSLGDKTKAKEYFQKLTALAANADTVRPDLAAARQFLATN